MVEINSDRAQAIEVARQSPTAGSEFRQFPVVIAGEKQMLPVYRLPTQLLAFNITNGRFASELKAKERELKRHLDPLDAGDAARIRELLLEQDPTATQILKDDLRKVGQTEPGIITSDGFVINGNRRMAIFHELHREEPTGRYQFLEVQILPRDVGPKDLWRIEAGIQLSRDKRLDYGPINDLLKIREGLQAGLSAAEIAATLYGSGGAEEIEEKDERLKLIDSFLGYINSPEQYNLVERRIEHFINLQNFMRWLKKSQGVSAKERLKWLMLAFKMLASENFTHMEIRKLRDIYGNDDARKYLEENIVTDTKPAQKQPDEATKAATRDTKAAQKQSDEAAKAATRDHFDTAVEYAELAKDLRKPERLLSRAERALEALLKHKADVVRRKNLHKRIASLKNRAVELDKACSVRKPRQ